MFCPVIWTPEEEKKIDEESRQADYLFSCDHPFLSSLFGFIHVLTLLAFGLFSIIAILYIVYVCLTVS